MRVLRSPDILYVSIVMIPPSAEHMYAVQGVFAAEV